MARPELPTVNIGAQNWGSANTQALQQLYLTPYPVPRHTGDESTLATTYPPAAYDQCIVWVNHTELGWLLYQSTGTAWVPLPQGGIAARRWVWEDFVNYTSGSGGAHPFAVTPLAGGDAFDVALAGAVGAVRIASAAAANSGAIIRTVNTASVLGDAGMSCVFLGAYTGAFATASLIRLGFLDTADHADAVDGAYFELASGVVYGKTASNSTRTASGTTFAPVINTLYRHVIRFASTTSVRFRIYDHLVGTKVYDQTISTNVPTGTTRAFGVGIAATTTASAAANHFWVDGAGFGPQLPAEYVS